MRLLLALPVLVVVLSMVLEGPAPAQATPDVLSTLENIPDKLKEFGNTLEDKTRAAIDHIRQSDIATKTRLGLFPGCWGDLWVKHWRAVHNQQIGTLRPEAGNVPMVSQLNHRELDFGDIQQSEGDTQRHL
uniref:Apolipoprotein C1 n=1 Tax=Sciurus vulgaris TaxID=55149 RepID=A0A8D2DKZ7_SCIVU